MLSRLDDPAYRACRHPPWRRASRTCTGSSRSTVSGSMPIDARWSRSSSWRERTTAPGGPELGAVDAIVEHQIGERRRRARLVVDRALVAQDDPGGGVEPSRGRSPPGRGGSATQPRPGRRFRPVLRGSPVTYQQGRPSMSASSGTVKLRLRVSAPGTSTSRSARRRRWRPAPVALGDQRAGPGPAAPAVAHRQVAAATTASGRAAPPRVGGGHRLGVGSSSVRAAGPGVPDVVWWMPAASPWANSPPAAGTGDVGAPERLYTSPRWVRWSAPPAACASSRAPSTSVSNSPCDHGGSRDGRHPWHRVLPLSPSVLESVLLVAVRAGFQLAA